MALIKKKKEVDLEEVKDNKPKKPKREFISKEKKANLKQGKRGNKVDLTSEEQLANLERMKLEEIEQDLRYRDSKKKPMNYTLHKVLSTTPTTTIITYYMFFVVIVASYLIYVTENTVVSLMFGALIGIFLVHSFVIKRGAFKRYMNNLFALSAYSTTVVHHLKTGNGVLTALRATRDSIEGDVKYDIIRTIKEIEDSAVLETTSFKRYRSSNLNIFHRILEIFYTERSTKAGEMFGNILKNISKEVEDKNKLKRMKETRAMTLYIMSGLSIGVPAILKMMGADNYGVFIAPFYTPYIVAIYMTVMFFILTMIHNSTLKVDLK